ncbi:MAG: ABC transporter permease [Xylanivirga thermophila]|jgi:putative tryptophan/tyrosine transport system permease protein
MWSEIFMPSIEQGLAFSIMAMGVYITFRVLKFSDLTVDGSFPLGGAVAAILITKGTNPWLATIIAFGCGCIAGCITGILNTKGNINELLSGILTMTALYSVNLRIMGKSNIGLLDQKNVFSPIENMGIDSKYMYLFLFIILVFALKLIMDWFLSTKLGLALRATGNNAQMIRSLGVNTELMKILGLGLSNGLIALSGALVAQYQGFADIGMGLGTIVAGLASVIIGEMLIGGTKLSTITFSIILGSFVYRMCITIALRLGLNSTDLKLLTSVLVIITLVVPQVKDKVKLSLNN